MRNDFYDLVNEMNNLFYNDGGYKSFPIDIIEGENSYLVIAEIPGVNKEDIHITFDDGEMTITAKQNVEKNKKYLIRERHPMTLKRTVSFGEIDEEKMSAKYENGLLYITILTKAPEKKEKKTITIE